MRTVALPPRSMYYGTPVALISTINADGSENLAAMSSSWSLRDRIVIGMGSASQTAENIARDREFTFNLASAALWRQVEILSSLTGKPEVPAHKAPQIRHDADKWAASGFTRRASSQVRPACVDECPLQMEAVVEHIRAVADEPEGFALIEARVVALWAHEDVAAPDASGVDAEQWRPLIFSFRSYRNAGTELGRMARAVRGAPQAAVPAAEPSQPAQPRVETENR